MIASLTRVEKALYGVCLALVVFLVSHLFRPCEVFRLKAVWSFAEFQWQNTVVQATPQEGCVCRTTDDDLWVLREKDQTPRRWEQVRREYPQVQF